MSLIPFIIHRPHSQKLSETRHILEEVSRNIVHNEICELSRDILYGTTNRQSPGLKNEANAEKLWCHKWSLESGSKGKSIPIDPEAIFLYHDNFLWVEILCNSLASQCLSRKTNG